MTRRIAAILLTAHGLIHLIGFVVPWGIAQVDGFAHRTTALGGAVALGDAGARFVGLAWLGMAIGFAVAGVALWCGTRWARPLTGALAIASAGVCVVGLPETAFGIAVNLAIVALVAWPAARRRGGAWLIPAPPTGEA